MPSGFNTDYTSLLNHLKPLLYYVIQVTIWYLGSSNYLGDNLVLKKF